MKRFREILRPGRSSASTFQVLSDLHLEVGQQYASFHLLVSAPDLILGGDIGRLIDYDVFLGFLDRQAQSFERVFWVLGNHEFYGISYEQGLKQAQKLQDEPAVAGKVFLLHRTRHELKGTNMTILGCTLWSRIPACSTDIVREKVKDFRKIRDWTVANHNAAFQEEVDWLRSQIESIRTEQPSREIMVITHHAPSTQNCSWPEHHGNPWNSAFGTDIIGQESWRRWTSACSVIHIIRQNSRKVERG